MRERARDKGRLEDIVEYSNNVSMLIEGYSFDKLVADKRTYYSVIKNVEIVGEAAYMLTNDFKKAHPEIPWKVVQGMRTFLSTTTPQSMRKNSTTQPLTICSHCVSKLSESFPKRTGTSGRPHQIMTTPLMMEV